MIQQSIEHAVQLTRAAAVLAERGEPIDNLLDAVECVLQVRLSGYRKTGTILSGLSGWEGSAGILKEGQTLYDLYKKPDDRDRSRDYTEGAVRIGTSSPEGLVYFGEVLKFYLAHRPAARLFNMNEQLTAVLARAEDKSKTGSR